MDANSGIANLLGIGRAPRGVEIVEIGSLFSVETVIIAMAAN